MSIEASRYACSARQCDHYCVHCLRHNSYKHQIMG